MPYRVAASNGRKLDVFTQKGGIGEGLSGGNFIIGENVELFANLTYNGFPVQQKLVSFAVTNAKGEIVTIETATTDYAGVANVNLTVQLAPDSIGTWKVVATADIACIVVSDHVTFQVEYFSPPHGPEAYFTESKENLTVFEAVDFDASGSLPGWDGIEVLPITEYRWDFGDGNKIVTWSPFVSHYYNQSGVYYVTLEVYAPGANPETNKSLPQVKIVTTPPVGGISVSALRSGEDKSVPFYVMFLAVCLVGLVAVNRKPKRRSRADGTD